MSLEGGKVLCCGEDGKIEKIFEPKEKIFTIGYYMSCDVIHEHPEVKGIHCEISCDSFGRITVKNYCDTRPIIVNGEAVAGTRPLLPGSTIEVVGKQFRWEYEPPSRNEDAVQTTPDAKANKVQPAPNSEPSAAVSRAVQKRLTVHSFAYGLNSNREEDTENHYRCSIIQPLQMNTNREIEENQSSANLKDITSNNENCTPKRRLSICSHSDLVFTSYSPRTGINTPKGFACVTPAKKTPKSLYATPRSALSEFNQSTNSRDFTTPKGGSSKLTATSMYLIDLITPLKPSRTPLKRTPLLKSALKNSVKGSAKDKTKKPTISGSSSTKFQGRKIALETPVKKKSISPIPKNSEQEQSAEGEGNVVLLDSITEQSTINRDSVFCNDSSVIEISSDCTPIRLEEKKQLKTPQLIARKAISNSVRKAKIIERDFAKKIKDNIERISESLPIISKIENIKNRRSSLPPVSTVVGRQSLSSQSSTRKLSKRTTTPQRILTTSTPFRSQKSIPKMVQSTPLKTANLTKSFRRHSCISSNQITPKEATKTPRKSIIKRQETKTPKKDNRSVVFTEKFTKSIDQIKENKEDALNATFIIDEEEEHSDGNKNGSKNNQSEILELQPLEKIGDFANADCLKDEKEHIHLIVDEEIQGIDIPEQTNISKTLKASDNKNRLNKISDNEEIQNSEISSNPFIASFTIESPKKVQTPNIITRSLRKHIAEHTPVVTDLKGLKDILETQRTLNRTPVKELFKTPKVEQSGSKEECVIKLMETPVDTPKALAAKQIFTIPKETKDENVTTKEIVRVPSIVKGSQNNFVDIEEIKTSEDILSPQKNVLDPSLKTSVSKTSTKVEMLDVVKDNISFTKILHDRYLDNPRTSAREPKSTETKSNIKTPKKTPLDIKDYTEFQSSDILESSDISNTLVAATRRPSTFNIETPKKSEKLEISINAEVQNTLASTGPDTLQRKLRRSTAYNITTPKNLQTPKKPICLKSVTEFQSSEITEIENLVPSTLASGNEHIQKEVLETESPGMKAPTNLHTPQKSICSKNTDDVQGSEKSESANIPNIPISGLESGQRKLRRSLHTITSIPKNLQTPKKLIALANDMEISNNADDGSTEELQIKEIAKNTLVMAHEPIQRKLQRSNTFDLSEVPKRMQTPEIEITLKDSVEVQSCKNSEKSDISSISTSGCEPIEKRLLRSSTAKTKIPTNSLDSTDCGEVEENLDIPVEQSISKAESSTNQQTETSIILENTEETQTDAITEHSGTKGALVAFKPVLGIIRKTASSKMKTMINPPTPETPIILDELAEVEKTEILENEDISTSTGQVQGNFPTSTISEAGTPEKMQTLKTSIDLEYDAETQRVQNSECANTPSTPIQVHNEFQRTSISKAKPQIGLQSPETSRALKCDAETQNGEISEHLSKINIIKRHSFMVIGQKISAVNRSKGSKESRRRTTDSSINKNLSEPTNDNNLLKTDLVAYSKNLNIVGKSVFTPKKIPSNDNLKLEHNAEDKNKSFSSLSEDINSDVPIKEKIPEAEPRKLFKSATFIIDSLKRPTISNSSMQKELTDSGIACTLTEIVDHSKQLLKDPKEVNQKPNLKDSSKLSKPLQTPRPLGVKELFNTPKPSKDINFVGVKELMKTPKVARDFDDNYHCLNELLKTPIDSVKHNETPNKSFKYDESCELGDNETLLIEDESYTASPISSQAEERHLQVKHEKAVGRKYKIYPTTPISELKSSSTKPRRSMNFFTATGKDVCSTESVKEFDQDQVEECAFSNTKMYNCPTTPIVELKNDLTKTRKSAVFYIDTEADVSSSESLKAPIEECLQSQMEEYESSDYTTDVTSREELNISPKSQKEGIMTLNESKDHEKTTVFIGVNELLNTPKDGSSENIRELGLKRLMKTPAETPKPVRIKELFFTPKPEKEENLVGVKELMHEPKNLDQTVVMLGVKELLNTPQDETSNEIRELGIKRLMKTPTQTPKPVRIKELFYSPKPEKEENLMGVKELMHTPKKLDQTTILVGIKELVKTPKKVKSPIPLGIKEMLNSSNTEGEACLEGIKELMKTPESLKYADINLTGVNELLEAPKSDTYIEDFLGMPEMFSTPHHKLINKKDEDNMKTSIVEFPDQEISQTSSLSPKNLSPQKQMSDLAFKTPSAKMVMVLGTPQSVNISTTKLVSSGGPPPLYDLKENMEDIEEVFPTAVIDEENDTLPTEESFNVGEPSIRKSYGRSRISQNNLSFATQFNKEKESELSKCEENAGLVLSSEEIDENSRDVSDNAAIFSMSGIKTLEKDGELEEMEILQNSQDEGVRDKIVTNLIPVNITSPETNTLKKTENKNIGKEMQYTKDGPPVKKEENSQTNSDVVHNESLKYIEENVVVEEKEEDINIISNDIVLEDEFTAKTYTRSLRARPKNVELPQKQKVIIVPKQTKIKRGRKRDDIIEEKLEINTPTEELMHTPDSTKTEFKNDLEDQVAKNSEINKLDSIKEPESIPEVKTTRRETRKRKVLNNDTDKEETIHGNPENAIQPKRATRSKRNLKAQIPDEQKPDPVDENQSHFIEEVGRKGRRGKLINLVEAKLVEKVYDEEVENEEEIKIPQSAKARVDVSNTALQSSDQNEDLEENVDKKENISNNLSSSEEATKPFSLPILIKTHGRRNAVVVSPKMKSVTVQKRKSDSESEEAVIPLKRMVRKRGANIKEDKQLNLETKTVTKRKAKNVEESNLSEKKVEEEVTPSSEQTTVTDKQENLMHKTTKVASSEGELENLSEDIENAKVEITPPRRGRTKQKADNNLNEIQPGSSSTESEAPPVRRGRPRRKANTVQQQISGNKTENTSSRRGTRRKVEDVIDNPLDLAVLTSPQRGKARRKVEETKAEKGKTNNLLNMSTDELTPINPAILKNLSEEKENVSTPKHAPNDALEFKTPISTAPRARRILRSNSISAQVSTPILQEQNQQETIVINDSVDKLENSLLAAATAKTRGRRRLNSTKNEIEPSNVDVEKLETEIELTAAKSIKTRGRPRINSTKEEEQIQNEFETSENAISVATTSRTRGRRRLNSTKNEIEPSDVDLEKLETESELSAAKSSKTRGRPKINSTKEEVQIQNEFETSENAISVATTSRTRGRKRINSTKDEVKIADINLEQPETSRTTRGRKKADVTKEETKSSDVEVEQPEISEILSTAAIGTRTRGKKRINSTKEVVQIIDDGKENPKITEEIPSTVTTSGRTRSRRNVNSAKN